MSRESNRRPWRYPPTRTASKQGPCLTKYSKLPIRLENFVMPFHLLKMKTNSKLRKIIGGHGSQMAVSVLSAAWRDSYFQHARCQKLDKLLNPIPITRLPGSEKQSDQNLQCAGGAVLCKRESNKFPETAGLQAEHSHGVSSGHMISLPEISFIISCTWFQDTCTWSHRDFQVSSKLKDNSRSETKPPPWHNKTAFKQPP